MTTLTSEQISHLTGLMDERFDLEMDGIRAVAARLQAERRQENIAGYPADQLDQALANMARAADYAVVRQDIEDVRDIVAARKRLAAGRFGVCVDCGEAIAYARLLVYPTAKRCIECQREHERGQAVREGRRAS